MVFYENSSSTISEENIQKNNREIENFTIVETGFNLYFLMKYIEEYKQNKGINYDDEVEVVKNDSSTVAEWEWFELILNIIVLFLKFPQSIILSLFYLIDLILYYFIYLITCGHFKLKLFITGLLNDYSNAISYDDFFSNYTRSIEISRNEKVYKIFFYLMPYGGNYREVKYKVNDYIDYEKVLRANAY